MTDISMDKQYQTRCGREVKIYETECGGKYPVHGAIVELDGTRSLASWAANGSYSFAVGGHSLDLIEVKQKLSGWVNIFSDTYSTAGFYTGTGVFQSKESARKATTSKDYITTIFLEVDPNDA